MLAMIIFGIVSLVLAAALLGFACGNEDEIPALIAIFPGMLGFICIIVGVTTIVEERQTPMSVCITNNITQSKQVDIDGETKFYEVTFKDKDGKTQTIIFTTDTKEEE